MPYFEQDRHGQWVFRNQRWYFVPGGAGYFDLEPKTVDRDSLAALVDPSELTRVIEMTVRASSLPVLVFFVDRRTSVDEWDRTDPKVTVGRPEQFYPAWFRELAAQGTALARACVEQLTDAAQAALVRGTPSSASGPLGSESAVAYPIGFSYGEKLVVHGAVAILAAGRDRLPAPLALASEVAAAPADAASWRKLLEQSLPTAAAARIFADLTAVNVAAYSARVQETLTHRLELAAEQARSRHHVVRAESLEKKLLSAPAPAEPGPREGDIIGRELESILDLPDLGVTVEDTDYAVRYVNPMMKRNFGNVIGRKCYEAFKGRSSPCQPCVLKRIWEDGETYVSYTSVDPRTGREFEVMSVPFISHHGEKMILEVGFQVTRAAKLARRSQEEAAGLRRRGQQLAELVAGTDRLMVDLSERVGEGFLLLQDETAHLASAARRADRAVADRICADADQAAATLLRAVTGLAETALCLAAPSAIGPAEVEALVRQAVAGLSCGPDAAAPEVSAAVMPRVETSPAVLERLLKGLVEELVRDFPGRTVRLSVSHTMSGELGSFTPGDRYHVLSLEAAAAGDGPAPPRELPECEEDAGPREGAALHLANLLVLRLGGALWETRYPDGRRGFYVSLPVRPPEF